MRIMWCKWVTIPLKDTYYLLCIHCKPIPVMKTGFSLCTFSHREKPVFISWDPCNENRVFPAGKSTQEKPCFHYRDGFAVWCNLHSVLLQVPILIFMKSNQSNSNMVILSIAANISPVTFL